MTPEQYSSAIEALLPGALERGAVQLIVDGDSITVKGLPPEITAESLAEALSAVQAGQAARQAAWDAAAAAFGALPLGKQALWEPVRARVAEFIREGDFLSAHTTIATVPSLYEGMETDRAVFLALFQ